jgi:hypothetical protein
VIVQYGVCQPWAALSWSFGSVVCGPGWGCAVGVVQAAQKAYSKIALAYDRFLKAGDLYVAYDPITSTEPFYQSIPDTAAIKYDNDATPQVTDPVRR